MIYCIVPHELAEELHDPLRRHFRDNPGVEVIVEQRWRERRRYPDRRLEQDKAPAEDRRRIHAEAGRRAGERRAALRPAEPRPLPRKLRRHAGALRFVERLERSEEELEDMDTARVVAGIQSGDANLYSRIYTRYFDRVYGYLRVLLRSRHDAEDATQDVFANVLAALPEYERREQPFRAWLFAIVRNTALRALRDAGRIEPVEFDRLADMAEENGGAEEELPVLNWISDPDLQIFVERLPIEHQQILLMRFMLDLPHSQVANALDKTEEDVRALQYRSLTYLRERLTAIGRAPESQQSGGGQKPTPARRAPEKANVLRARRYALYR